MDSDSNHIYAVITGDFIGFSGMKKEVRRFMPEVMEQAGGLVRRLLPGVMTGGIEIFRGDSWQALLGNPVHALRAAIIIRACIKRDTGGSGLDTRMAIGVGSVDYVHESQVSAGDGPAFRYSGKMLEKMTSSRNTGLLRYCRPEAPCESLVDALLFTVGELSGNWRPLQARAVLEMLKGMSRAEIAANWPAPVSRQAVSKHVKNACWPAVAYALEVFEEVHKVTI